MNIFGISPPAAGRLNVILSKTVSSLNVHVFLEDFFSFDLLDIQMFFYF